MRNRIFALLLSIPSGALGSEVSDFAIVRFDASDEGVLELTTKDKSSTIRLSKDGLHVDKLLLCDWYWQGDGKRPLAGPLGMIYGKEGFLENPARPCPKDSPIVDASVVGYLGVSAESTPFTAIRIVSIKNWLIQVPYRGKVYQGQIEQWNPRVFAAKGSAIDQQVKAEKKIISEKRENELKALGIAQTRAAIASCLTPKLKPEPCLGGLVPSGRNSFKVNAVGEVAKLNLDQLKRKLTDDKEFSSNFEACVTTFGPKFDRGRYGTSEEFITDKQGDNVSIILDEDTEMHWKCHFKRIDGKWHFIEMIWSGC